MKHFDYNEYTEQLRELVNIESGSFYPEGVDRMAEVMAKKYLDLGLYVEKKRFDSRAGFCLEVTNRPEAETFDVLMTGHMDTVFPVGTVAQRPFSTDGKAAFGPGVIDMKSGLLNMYYIVRELVLEHSDVIFCLALNSDEEISSRYSNPWISGLAKRSRCGLVFEPARKSGDMVRDRKGLARFDVDFRGIYAHAGVNPQDGASAVHEMAEWIHALVPLNAPAQGTSLNVGVARGGLGANTVAEEAHCEIDIRFSDIDECRRIEAAIEILRQNPKTPGVTASVRRVGFRPPMVSTELSRKMMQIMSEEGSACGVSASWVATGGGSDGNFIAFEGCPVMDAVGPVGDGAHGSKELLWLDTVKPRTEMVYRAILRMKEEGLLL